MISILICGNPINIDGQFDDWIGVPIAYNDAEGDHVGADYSILKITNDSQFLFIYFNFFNDEFLMQNWNDFHLYIDSDNNSTTGQFVNGIGAELVWAFGDRWGYGHVDGQEYDIYQNDLTLRIAPTVTSMEFEIAISLNSSPLTLNGSQILSQARLILSEMADDGDFVPNESGGVTFVVDHDFVDDSPSISLERESESDIRIISYNTWNEGILDSERQIRFKRIIQGLNPDVIGLQEHGEWDQIDGIIQSWFPDEEWYASWTYNDLVILSRFPILNDANIISSGRTMAALLNTVNELGHNLLIFNSHLSCCDNDESRQQQVDEFSGVWRDWMQEGSGPFEIEEQTPFIHIGDFNFVGYSQQIRTIRDGDIEDQEEFGNDYFPDWDSTPIRELFPRHSHKRMGYTWRNDGSSFNPGKLDYVFYSNFTINPGNYYILNTLELNDATLEYFGFQRYDTHIASDHLPIVFDISIDDNIGVAKENHFIKDLSLYPNYPNPFNSQSSISFYLPFKSMVDVSIIDISGKVIVQLINEIRPKGNHSIKWNGKNNMGYEVTSGLYFSVLKFDGYLLKRKMILVK